MEMGVTIFAVVRETSARKSLQKRQKRNRDFRETLHLYLDPRTSKKESQSSDSFYTDRNTVSLVRKMKMVFDS